MEGADQSASTHSAPGGGPEVRSQVSTTGFSYADFAALVAPDDDPFSHPGIVHESNLPNIQKGCDEVPPLREGRERSWVRKSRVPIRHWSGRLSGNEG